MVSMKIYYAHPINMYGSDEEKNEIAHIMSLFGSSTIVNPSIYEGRVNDTKDRMIFYLNLVRDCDIVVFRRLAGKISAGVGKEVNFALKSGKVVYELQNQQIIAITQPVDPISVEETRRLLKIAMADAKKSST